VDLLDLFIVVAAFAYAVGGFRNGAVVGLFSLVGFIGGAVAGAQFGRPLANSIAHGRGQVVVALVCVLVGALVGQLALVYVARLLRGRIKWRAAQAVDSGIGAVLGIVSVLLVAWMVAAPLTSSPYPNLASQARRSAIVAHVNDVVPGDLRNVYSSLQNYIDRSGFPPLFDSFKPTQITNVGVPDGELADSAGVALARASVLKIYGQAPSCGRAIEGSGFVFAPNLMLTNAHVVAGTNKVTVQTATGSLAATVVVYDPEADVAVLRVPKLTAAPLAFAATAAAEGADAIVVGYPADGNFTPAPARVRDQEKIVGHDIYGKGTITREIYAIRGTVISGNSGGPLISPAGEVYGIVFAKALDDTQTGFVLTNAEIAPDVALGRTETTAKSTGACAA
jgi:S1-C subfamily serine protease